MSSQIFTTKLSQTMKMKLTLATAAVVVLGQSIPVAAHSEGIIKSALKTGLFQYVHDVLEESKSLSSSRRAQQTLSQECIDEIDMREEDDMFEAIVDDNNDSCQTNKIWLSESGTFVSVRDFRTCDTSELRAFCDANYQSFEFPELKVTCDLVNTDSGTTIPQGITYYLYDFVTCSGKSCPSNPADWSIEDYFAIIAHNSSDCTVEALGEGEEPPSQPLSKPETLPQECTDEIDVIFADPEYSNIWGQISEVCPSEPYMSNNDTIFVRDLRDCDTSGVRAFCNAKNYQSFEYPDLKIICPGNIIVYFYANIDCVGTSCPSDPADWLISDLKYLIPDTASCDWGFLEDGEEPPPRPVDPSTEPSPFPPPTEPPPRPVDPSIEPSPFLPPTDDPSTAASPMPTPTDDPSSAASEFLLPWTNVLLPAFATMALALPLMG